MRLGECCELVKVQTPIKISQLFHHPTIAGWYILVTCQQNVPLPGGKFAAGKKAGWGPSPGFCARSFV
jgi:hypothetical protein